MKHKIYLYVIAFILCMGAILNFPNYKVLAQKNEIIVPTLQYKYDDFYIVPLRQTLEAIGATVTWNPNNGYIVVQYNNIHYICADRKKAFSDGIYVAPSTKYGKWLNIDDCLWLSTNNMSPKTSLFNIEGTSYIALSAMQKWLNIWGYRGEHNSENNQLKITSMFPGISSNSSSNSSNKEILVMIDNENTFTVYRNALPMNISSYIFTDENETVIVPLRSFCEEIGCEVSWNAEDSSIIVTSHSTNSLVKFYVDKRLYEINTKEYEADFDLYILDGTTYMPMSKLCVILGYSYNVVDWY